MVLHLPPPVTPDRQPGAKGPGKLLQPGAHRVHTGPPYVDTGTIPYPVGKVHGANAEKKTKIPLALSAHLPVHGPASTLPYHQSHSFDKPKLWFPSIKISTVICKVLSRTGSLLLVTSELCFLGLGGLAHSPSTPHVPSTTKTHSSHLEQVGKMQSLRPRQQMTNNQSFTE